MSINGVTQIYTLTFSFSVSILIQQVIDNRNVFAWAYVFLFFDESVFIAYFQNVELRNPIL